MTPFSFTDANAVTVGFHDGIISTTGPGHTHTRCGTKPCIETAAVLVGELGSGAAGICGSQWVSGAAS